MKNCFIVLVVLAFCFVAACFLFWEVNMNGGRGFAGGSSLMVARWMYYDGQPGYEVTILPNQIIVDQLAFKSIRYQQPGHWSHHAFYCDSHMDAPPEIAVAHELANEDLEVDLGYFKPGSLDKIVCVKMLRGGLDYHPPYPTASSFGTVTYPPPRGLIRPGMLECDLRMLPWRADRIDIGSGPVHSSYQDTLSDGKVNKDFLGTDDDNSGDNDPWQPSIYTFHSDRAGAPQLLVTVHHGRVVQVDGGAEETSDIPYQLPPPPPPDADATPPSNRTWVGWLFDSIFGK